MNNEQKINAWFAKFEHRLNASVPKVVAETATEFYKERFRTQEWDGSLWDDLSPNYAARKTQGAGRILTKTGILMNSIHPSTVNARKVVISAGGSMAPYARVHNEGLRVAGVRTIRPYTNTNFMGKGKAVPIRGHQRTVNYQMPQRQFMGHSRFLNRILMDRLTKDFNSK